MDMRTAGPATARLEGTIACIDADTDAVAAVEAIVERHAGIRLLKAGRGREGLRLVQQHRPGLLLLDLDLPDIDGLEVLRQLGAMTPAYEGRIVLLTQRPFDGGVTQAMSLGAGEYWHKPVHEERLMTELRRALTPAQPVDQAV